MSETIGVIGAGSWGTAIAKILGDNERDVLLWARRSEVIDEINRDHQNSRYLPDIRLPRSIEATKEIQLICRKAKLIIVVIPSHAFRQTVHQLGAYLDGEHLLIHATKGIEDQSFKRMSELLREETPVRKIGVLSGPNLALEIAQEKPSGTVIASRYDDVVRRVQEAMNNSYFRVYGSSDVVGAEIGGTFKNIVALAAGVADGLELGANTKALLMTRGVNEMARFGMAMGAKVLTFGGMAGFGDMMATCSSSLSRNHQVGERLAKGEKLEAILDDMKMVAEGVKATKAVYAFCEAKKLKLPIVDAVYRLLYQDQGVEQVIKGLMSEDAGDEFMGFSL